MKPYIEDLKEMRSYLLLWSTQLLSGLGSAMTSYALVIWSYTQAGSALGTAGLMVCSYAPYVVCSIFAGALSDRWDKKRTIWHCLMLSMCTENFFLAFGDRVWLWCVGAALGWVAIPWMNANLDSINRLSIPVSMQGRVFAVRNSLQFFTIPLGYFLGGLLVDRVFEPVMAAQGANSVLVRLFGAGKGSGAAFLFAVLWLTGIGVCLIFRGDGHIWHLEDGA